MPKRSKFSWFKYVLVLLGLFVIVGIAGPKPPKVDFTKLQQKHYPTDLHQLEDSLNAAEAALPLKPDNQARIIWDTPYVKTAYSIVYLHGNGASQEEGDPIHEALAHRYGCNLFLARLDQHGLKGDDLMLHLNPAKWMQSALDAIEVGKAIGDKVILVSCSTGSTLGLYLESQYPGLVSSHIMFSPNIDLYDSKSFLLVQPWGLQIARLVLRGKNYTWEAPKVAEQYWYTSYRIEGLITLKAIINQTMTHEDFNKIKDPVFMAYYYRDEENQDHEVSVRRMLEMYRQLSTPENLKRKVALPDADTHIIASDMFNDHLGTLWTPLVSYCEEVLKLTPVDSSDYITFMDLRPK
ncbi:MAG TPA: alpha/beta hydrolase [Saprospiraceae bacterium]|nr:alpha/beta hydrolase [Saprospiraceae bacterium]